MNRTFTLSPAPDGQVIALEAWGRDRMSLMQAGLAAALALTTGEDTAPEEQEGPVVPLRAEGDTLAALFADLLDDLMAQIETHGPMQGGRLDGVLKRDRGGFVAWGYLSPRPGAVAPGAFERLGAVEALVETPDETRLRVALRRLA